MGRGEYLPFQKAFPPPPQARDRGCFGLLGRLILCCSVAGGITFLYLVVLQRLMRAVGEVLQISIIHEPGLLNITVTKAWRPLFLGLYDCDCMVRSCMAVMNQPEHRSSGSPALKYLCCHTSLHVVLP